VALIGRIGQKEKGTDGLRQPNCRLDGNGAAGAEQLGTRAVGFMSGSPQLEGNLAPVQADEHAFLHI